MRKGGRVRGRVRDVRGDHVQRRQQLSNEIRATLVDHVINHGLTLREAGETVMRGSQGHYSELPLTHT